MQDVQTGRFLNADPYAEKYFGLTPYNYAANNPVSINDPLGDQMKYPGDNGRMQKGPDGNYHAAWFSSFMWENKNSFNFGLSWGSSGGGSAGIVFNLFHGIAKGKDQRYSLESATDKNGIEGIWISWWEEGSNEAGMLQELVGHSVFLSNSSIGSIGEVGFQNGISANINFGTTFLQTNEYNDASYTGNTATTKISTKKFNFDSGFGDEILFSSYTGKIIGESGSIITNDQSSTDGKFDGSSISFFKIITIGYGINGSVYASAGFFGYESHVGLGIGNGLGQISVGASFTNGNDQNGLEVKINGGGLTAAAAAAACIVTTGGWGLFAF